MVHSPTAPWAAKYSTTTQGPLLPFLTPPGPFLHFLPTPLDFSLLLYDFSQALLLLLSEFYSWHIIPCCTKSTLVKAAAFE